MYDDKGNREIRFVKREIICALEMLAATIT